jgi:hypothetical protein
MILKKLKIGLLILTVAAACSISYASGKNTSILPTDYYGLVFDDGTIVMVFYPDQSPRTLTDVSSRFKAAWMFTKSENK